MLVVTIALWPQGDKNKARVLGEMHIANEGGTGTLALGNYATAVPENLDAVEVVSDGALSVHIPKSPEYARTPGTWKHGQVKGFPRLRLGPWDLLYRALVACGMPKRNP